MFYSKRGYTSKWKAPRCLTIFAIFTICSYSCMIIYLWEGSRNIIFKIDWIQPQTSVLNGSYIGVYIECTKSGLCWVLLRLKWVAISDYGPNYRSEASVSIPQQHLPLSLSIFLSICLTFFLSLCLSFSYEFSLVM